MSWKHTFGTKTFEEFVKRFFKDSSLTNNYKVHYFNKKVVVELGQKNAEIVLKENGYCGHYKGFRLDILNRDNGLIAGEWFAFKDYLKKPEDKEDKSDLHVWESSMSPDDIDWYCNGAIPESIQTMINRMVEYMRLYAQLK